MLSSLNNNGEALLKQARMVKAQYTRFMQQAEQLQHNQKQSLKIGIDPLLFPKSIIRLVQDFEATFPSVEVYLIYRDSKSLNELLGRGELALLIGGNEGFLLSPEFHTESIGVVENIWVATEENAKRINQAQELFELSIYRYLIPPQFQSDLLKPITDFASVWWVDDTTTLFQMCHSNSNIACISRTALDSLSQYDTLRVLNSRFLPKMSKELVLSWQLDIRTRPFCQWMSQAVEYTSKQDYRSRIAS